jgi:hypothetical protein
MSLIKCLASMSLAALILPAFQAEPHFPGNVASLPFRFVHHHQIILALSVNHTGPTTSYWIGVPRSRYKCRPEVPAKRDYR